MSKAKRRSLLDFEQWLDEQIAAVDVEMLALAHDVAEVTRKRTVAETRLATLRHVRDRLAQRPDGDTFDLTFPAVEEAVDAAAS